MKKIITMLCCLLTLSSTLSGCSKNVAPGSYDATEIGKVKKVVPGVIISKRAVTFHTRDNDAAGTNNNSNNSNDSSNTAADVANGVMHSHGFEYVIRLNSGTIISVVQAEDLQLKVKQHILVINGVNGSNTRVVADDGSDDF